MVTSERVDRFFYRCGDCLGVYAVNEAHEQRHPCPYCDAGEERCIPMGRVHREKLVKDHTGSPCDDRCTTAHGPICDCHCGGANHGTWALVTWMTEHGTETGAARLTERAQREVETLRQQAAEYKTARARAEEVWGSIYGAVTERKRSGEYLPGADWDRYLSGQWWRDKLRDILALKTHKTRQARLAKWTADLEAKRAGVPAAL